MHSVEITKLVLREEPKDEGAFGPWPTTPASPLQSPASTPRSKRSHARTRSRTGHEVQEAKNMYLVNAWDLSADTPEITEEATGYDVLPNTPATNLEYRIHAQFNIEPYTMLTSPLTEIVLWTKKAGAPREKIEELLTSLMEIVNSIPSSEGMYKAGWGPVMENEDQFVVLIGWENMEAFQTAVRNSPDGRALLDELDKYTDRQLRHVTLNDEEAL